MSFRSEKFLKYKGTNVPEQINQLKSYSEEQLNSLFMEILNRGVHGFCFSLYEEGQKPGDVISEAQIRKRLKIIQPYSRWVRSFSCTEGNEYIPRVAKELGMKTLVGAWLGSDHEKNQKELEGLFKLAKDGMVDIAAVGNEVLYRNDLSEEELKDYIKQAKAELPDIPVGYVDAYYEFVERPWLAEISDVILCNCYPYWEGTPYDYAFDHMRHMFQLAVNAANGKRVIITETGWPSKGEGLGGADPSHLNAMKYFINTHLWAVKNEIETFYFSSFDEAWKVSSEGEVGAYWGVWDSKGNLKFG